MTTTTLEHKPTETPEEAKARRNAEYLAMLTQAVKDIDEGKGITVTVEELEAMTNA
jgi:hypothetical protein